MFSTASNLSGDSICHGFFTRCGGVSEGIYASLNCGPGSQDEAAKVTENRRRVVEMLGMPDAHLLTLYQIHSAEVVTVKTAWADEERPKADAMVTNQPNLLLGILTADCASVLFADAKSGVIGAAHAGWKGALYGVLENTLTAMEQLGATRDTISAALGPCIHQPSYEVSAAFRQTFLDVSAANAAFFVESVKAGHFQFDLPGFIQQRLAQSGLQDVQALAKDTYANEQEYFSYRRSTHRGEADYGRQISVIGLKG